MSSLKNNTLKNKSKTPLVDVKQNLEKANTLYKELCRNDDDKSFAELYFSITTRSIAYDEKSDTVFIFNKLTTVWENVGRKSLRNYYSDDMSELFDTKLKKLKELTEDLDEEEIAKKKKKIETLKKRVRNISSVSAQVEFLLPLFENKEIISKMDTDTHLFSFNNGVIDLKTGIFRKRVETDYIARKLSYDYTEEKNEKIINEVNGVIKRICNDNDEHANSIKSWLGYCMTGETTEQCFMFFVGVGASNGKSTLLDMYSKSFPIYEIEVKNDTFCLDNPTYHKQMNAMNKKRLIRMEEMKAGKKWDIDQMKKVSGGGVDTGDVMYGNTTTQPITGKLNLNSNSLPLFDACNGFLRRIRVSTHINIFKDKEVYDTIKDKTNLYIRDKGYEKKFENPLYSLSFFQILLPFAISYYTKGITLCKDLTSKGQDLFNENDIMAEYVESIFVRTNNSEDRVSKELFLDLYNNYTKGKSRNTAWTKILSNTMRCKLQYESQFRCDGRKGCFINLKVKMVETPSCDFIDDSKPANLVSGLDEGVISDFVESKIRAISDFVESKIQVKELAVKPSSTKFVAVKDKKSHGVYDLMCGTRKVLLV